MKNLIYLALISIIVISCSSDDDDATPPEDLSQTELLVNGSPWSFDSAEIVSVQENELNLNNDTLISLTEANSRPDFTFQENGTVFLENNGNEVTAAFAIVNGNLEFVAQDDSELTLESFEVSETEFSYETIVEEVGGTDQFLYSQWTARLIFN